MARKYVCKTCDALAAGEKKAGPGRILPREFPCDACGRPLLATDSNPLTEEQCAAVKRALASSAFVR
jgi:hypothetical protein